MWIGSIFIWIIGDVHRLDRENIFICFLSNSKFTAINGRPPAEIAGQLCNFSLLNVNSFPKLVHFLDCRVVFNCVVQTLQQFIESFRSGCVCWDSKYLVGCWVFICATGGGVPGSANAKLEPEVAPKMRQRRPQR